MIINSKFELLGTYPIYKPHQKLVFTVPAYDLAPNGAMSVMNFRHVWWILGISFGL